jgi:hypothetical protein
MPWIPVFIGNPGFLLEFTPMKIGAGMTNLPTGCHSRENRNPDYDNFR